MEKRSHKKKGDPLQDRTLNSKDSGAFRGHGPPGAVSAWLQPRGNLQRALKGQSTLGCFADSAIPKQTD